VLLSLLALSACGDDELPTGSGGTPPAHTIDLTVDANRDGVVDPDDPGDQDEDAFGPMRGASFLVNLDDDDGDKIRDIDDEILNGEADLLDLARIHVGAFAGAPEGATGKLSIDAAAAEHVRIWKKLSTGLFELVLGSKGPCTDAAAACQYVTEAELSLEEVRAGVEFGIEGRSFRMDPKDGAWNGIVSLKYGVRNGDGLPVQTADAPDGFDVAVMRVAPWILFGNTSNFDTAWASDDSPEFVEGLTAPLAEGKVNFRKITNWSDPWVQDYFQTGYTAIPAPNGEVHGMRIANPRPWGRGDESSNVSLPVNWLKKTWLSPDRGIVVVYKQAWSGDTYDSHGNHDLLPPYQNGAEEFPLGRIITGSGVLPETHAFYKAQGMQGPPLVVDTTWLIVGHVDEVFSYVPAKTPRGWKLLVGSPKMAREMLMAQQQKGNGAVAMFKGKQRWGSGNFMIDAEVTIDEVLADQDIMGWSQEAQIEIDGMLADVRAAVGLADDEIIEIPYLFEADSWGKVAFNPGTANLLAFGDTVVHPDPFGPVIDGKDIFKKDLQDRLGTSANALGSTGQGLNVRFADDWYTYHINLGEVHCGSNVDGPPPAGDKWWETGR
jgi:protein-arginine deiminase